MTTSIVAIELARKYQQEAVINHLLRERLRNARERAYALIDMIDREEPRDNPTLAVLIPTAGCSLKAIELAALLAALDRTQWSQMAAALLLQITPRVFNYKVKQHGIQCDKWPKNRSEGTR